MTHRKSVLGLTKTPFLSVTTNPEGGVRAPALTTRCLSHALSFKPTTLLQVSRGQPDTDQARPEMSSLAFQNLTRASTFEILLGPPRGTERSVLSTSRLSVLLRHFSPTSCTGSLQCGLNKLLQGRGNVGDEVALIMNSVQIDNVTSHRRYACCRSA